MTNRDVIALVRSDLKLTSGDDLISDRAILAKLKNIAAPLIKRETDRRKLFATDSLFTTIPCIPMIQVPIAECCAYKGECNISRSENKLPKVADGVWGYLIQGVFSIDGKYRFTEGTAQRFVNAKKMPLAKKEDFFWIENDYIYVSNDQVELIMGKFFFEDDVNPSDYSCDKDSADACYNPLDAPFKCPSYIIATVVDILVKNYAQMYLNIQEDQTDEK